MKVLKGCLVAYLAWFMILGNPPDAGAITFRDRVHVAEGTAILSESNHVLNVSNLGTSNNDGVAVHMGGSAGSKVFGARIDQVTFDPNDEFRLPFFRSGVQQGQVRLRGTADGKVDVNGTFAGSSTNTVEVYRNGALQQRITGVSGVAAKIGQSVSASSEKPAASTAVEPVTIIIIIIILVLIPATASIACGGDHNVEIGNGLWSGIGDEIRVLPEAATIASTADVVKVLGGGISSFAVSDEISALPSANEVWLMILAGATAITGIAAIRRREDRWI